MGPPCGTFPEQGTSIQTPKYLHLTAQRYPLILGNPHVWGILRESLAASCESASARFTQALPASRDSLGDFFGKGIARGGLMETGTGAGSKNIVVSRDGGGALSSPLGKCGNCLTDCGSHGSLKP